MTDSRTPDNWVIIHLKGEDPHYRVLGGWSGGYTQGDSWRLNSGISSVKKNENFFVFFGASGSSYVCHEDTYGLRMNNAHIWSQLQEIHGDKVEIMPEDTDWRTLDWIIK